MTCDRIEPIAIDYPRRAKEDPRKFAESIGQGIEHAMSRRKLSDASAELAVVFLLNYESDYHVAKRTFAAHAILTQFVRRQNLRRLNLSVASNVMKQLNQKTGGEHIRVALPAAYIDSGTMVIGIDVCHAGKNSVVGFAASTNRHCTSYWSSIIIQPKNQELVKKDLDTCLRGALAEYQQNVGSMPARILVYRDGVGEQMRDQIIAKEVGQFQSTLSQLCNKMDPPKLTLIVVNKRINQRMFIESRNAYENPEPGTILDHSLVENNDGNKVFDFFLVP